MAKPIATYPQGNFQVLVLGDAVDLLREICVCGPYRRLGLRSAQVLSLVLTGGNLPYDTLVQQGNICLDAGVPGSFIVPAAVWNALLTWARSSELVPEDKILQMLNDERQYAVVEGQGPITLRPRGPLAH